MTSLFQCVECGKGVSCSIDKEVRVCDQCKAMGNPCKLLELNIPFDIIHWHCDDHKHMAYSADDGNGV